MVTAKFGTDSFSFTRCMILPVTVMVQGQTCSIPRSENINFIRTRFYHGVFGNLIFGLRKEFFYFPVIVCLGLTCLLPLHSGQKRVLLCVNRIGSRLCR